MAPSFLAASLLALLATADPPTAPRDAGSPPKVETIEKSKDARPKKARLETATFAGGCFWSFEAVFEQVPGVKGVVPGFTGGDVPFPSYQLVCTGQTGHAEAINVEYDPEVVPFEKLLKVFWMAHDPTTLNSQGDDFGTQYRSAVFYHGEAQRLATLASYHDLTDRHVYHGPIVTQLVPYQSFFPAEEYHQDYFRHHRDSDYTITYILPKLKKLKPKLKALAAAPAPKHVEEGQKNTEKDAPRVKP